MIGVNYKDIIIYGTSVVVGGAVGHGVNYLIDKFLSNNDEVVSVPAVPAAKPNDTIAEKYDRFGYDAEGYNKHGYDRTGFNREGFDLEGYGHNKYNIRGTDRAGNNRSHYMKYLGRLYTLKEESLKLLKVGLYRYALLNSRTIVDDALSLIIGHYFGSTYNGVSLSAKIGICEKNNIFGDNQELLSGLRGVCRVSSPRLHTIEDEKNITHEQVYFTIMQSMELLQVAEQLLVRPCN